MATTKIDLDVPASDGGGAASEYGGGDATLIAHGSDFDDGTLMLEVSLDGINYVTAKDVNGNDAALTASGMFNVNLPAKSKIRLTLSGATGSDNDVTASLARRYQTVLSGVV